LESGEDDLNDQGADLGMAAFCLVASSGQATVYRRILE